MVNYVSGLVSGVVLASVVCMATHMWCPVFQCQRDNCCKVERTYQCECKDGKCLCSPACECRPFCPCECRGGCCGD